MMNWVSQLVHRIKPGHRKLYPETDYVVTFNDTEIRCESPDGQSRKLEWSALKSVEIETSDRGGWQLDIFWILNDSRKGRCVIPLGATGESQLTDRLQLLPEFDDEAFIEAMESTSRKKFLCWKASAATPLTKLS